MNQQMNAWDKWMYGTKANESNCCLMAVKLLFFHFMNRMNGERRKRHEKIIKKLKKKKFL